MRDGAEYFVEPKSPEQMRYEALRAYFVEQQSAAVVAERFDYTPDSIYVLANRLRDGKLDPFHQSSTPGPKPTPRPDELVEAVLKLRDEGLTVYEISEQLPTRGLSAGKTTVWRILDEHGKPPLPPGRTPDQPDNPGKPNPAPRATSKEVDLSTGLEVKTRYPLVFLFAPQLACLGWDEIVEDAGYPSTEDISATSRLRAMLCLKLLNRPRRSHTQGLEHDRGLGLFASLNVLPKATALHDYSYQFGSAPNRALLEGVTGARVDQDVFPTDSFELDFHAIRHHGHEPSLEKHYVPRRSQRTKGVLTSFAQEHESRELVYASAAITDAEKKHEVLKFIDYWEALTGKRPGELVFDGRFTTQAVLSEVDDLGIDFITLRDRRQSTLDRVAEAPEEEWTQIRVDIPKRGYKNPSVLDQRVTITDYPGEIRQLAIKGLGREKPTLLITNNEEASPAQLVTRYARRSPVENAIGEQVHFFGVDALASGVKLKVELDVVLTTIASQLYRWLATELPGFEVAQAETLWRTFLDQPGEIRLEEEVVELRVRRFSHAPTLLDSELVSSEITVPWLGDRRVRVEAI